MSEATKTKREEILEAVRSAIEDLKSDFGPETDREDLIERMDEETDTLFGQLVQHGRIDKYDVDDLVRTAGDCAEIIKLAQDVAWVEYDNGLWEGLTYGVLASIAYFSLRNVLYQMLEDEGIDSNDDFPFAKDDDQDDE